MKINENNQMYVYTINCPTDAFWDIYDMVQDDIDSRLSRDELHPRINDTLVAIYSHVESTLPPTWAKIVLENDDPNSLVDFVTILEEYLQLWYNENLDAGEKKTLTPEHVSDSHSLFGTTSWKPLWNPDE